MSDPYELIDAGLALKGERITEFGELSDDPDDLLALSVKLGDIIRVAQQVRREVDEKTAVVLGAGQPYVYGGYRVVWQHGWKWRVDEDSVVGFLDEASELGAEAILDLFNPNSIRKTGVERVARRLDLDPETVVDTVLYREWDAEPRLQWKWIGEAQNGKHDVSG